MNLESGLSLLVVIALMVLVAALISRTRLDPKIKLLVYLALALRAIGAVGREATSRDANVYLRWGRDYAEYFSRFDFSPLYDETLWRGSSWLGTNFVGYPVGFVISLLGPGRMSTFFVFALLGFLGVVAFAVAYRRAFPHASYAGYWAWVFLFPSLWFWPSSVGKEALVLLGIGVATLGFAGRGGRPSWPLTIVGLSLVFVIRPQVAAVFIFAVTLAYWLDFERWTHLKALRGVAILLVGTVGIWYTMDAALDGEVGFDSVEAYIDGNAARNQGGGSSFEGVGARPSGVPVAMFNVLFRPFPWEAHNMAAAFSALEIMLMWTVILFRRRQISVMLRNWRTDRMIRFALPFVLLYVITLGMNLSNLGLMARQRTLVLPLLFLLVEAGGALRTRAQARPELAELQTRRSPAMPPRIPERIVR
jgi:hypothetical protein